MIILLLVCCFLDIVVAVGQNIKKKIFFHSWEDTLQIPELDVKVRGSKIGNIFRKLERLVNGLI